MYIHISYIMNPYIYQTLKPVYIYIYILVILVIYTIYIYTYYIML